MAAIAVGVDEEEVERVIVAARAVAIAVELAIGIRYARRRDRELIVSVRQREVRWEGNGCVGAVVHDVRGEGGAGSAFRWSLVRG